MSRSVRVIKKGVIVDSTLEEVREAAFSRLDQRAAERQAKERMQQWIYEYKSNKLIQELSAREFWKLL